MEVFCFPKGWDDWFEKLEVELFVGISGACASMHNVPILGFQVHSLILLFCTFLGAVTPFSYFVAYSI